jgi:hypothetical protein
MRIELDLSTDESIALRRLATEIGADLPTAAKRALRDWLIGNGYLELLGEEPEPDSGE